MYESVPNSNAKAIGTPIAIALPTTKKKKMTRLMLPSVARYGRMKNIRGDDDDARRRERDFAARSIRASSFSHCCADSVANFAGDRRGLSRSGSPRDRILRLRAIGHWFVRYLRTADVESENSRAHSSKRSLLEDKRMIM